MSGIDLTTDPSTPSDGGPTETAPDGGTRTTTTTSDGTKTTTTHNPKSGTTAIKIFAPDGSWVRILIKKGKIVQVEK